MKNYDEWVKLNFNSNWPCIPGHPCRILIIGSSWHRQNWCVTEFNETSMTTCWQNLFVCQRSIQIRVSTKEKKYENNPKAFINFHKPLIADMKADKKISAFVTDLFMSGIKLSISLVFISQSHFKVPKDINQMWQFMRKSKQLIAK